MTQIKRLMAGAAALALLAGPAQAVETAMQLTLTLEGNAQRDVVTYECEGLDAPVTVDYVNAHPIFLAIVPVEGERLIFVNVVAASGARYVSGQWVWWSRGATATLEDEMADEGAEPIECISIADTP